MARYPNLRHAWGSIGILLIPTASIVSTFKKKLISRDGSLGIMVHTINHSQLSILNNYHKDLGILVALMDCKKVIEVLFLVFQHLVYSH